MQVTPLAVLVIVVFAHLADQASAGGRSGHRGRLRGSWLLFLGSLRDSPTPTVLGLMTDSKVSDRSPPHDK